MVCLLWRVSDGVEITFDKPVPCVNSGFGGCGGFIVTRTWPYLETGMCCKIFML